MLQVIIKMIENLNILKYKPNVIHSPYRINKINKKFILRLKML